MSISNSIQNNGNNASDHKLSPSTTMKDTKQQQPPTKNNASTTMQLPIPSMMTSMAPPPASLYVGELDTNVTEANLFEIFNTVGPVASIRVCRDTVTRKSLGYAYINYHNQADGERALETLNYTPIKGKPCRIMWSQRDSSSRKNVKGNIFIKNLDASIDNKALHDTFSAFGKILSCKVVIDELGNSKGYGYVHFEQDEAAENAIKSVNGMSLNDKIVFVGPHISKKERQSKEEEAKNNFTNIYIKNLDQSINENKLKDIFGKCGTITSVSISKDDQNVSKGFAFVNFESVDSAKKAIDLFHDKELEGRVLYVSRAQKKNEREEELKKAFEKIKLEKATKYQGSNLYIKNLDENIDEEVLRKEFEQFGEITSVKIMKDEKEASKGFGFVCFNNPEDASQALTKMNGKVIGEKPCYIAFAQRKDERRAMLEQQIAQRNQLRMQAAGGMFPGNPMFYPGISPAMNPAFTPNQRPMMYPQAGMMPPRRFPGQPNMPPPGFPPQAAPMYNMRQMKTRQPMGRPVPQIPRGYPGLTQSGQGSINQGNFEYNQILGQNPLDPSLLAALSPEQQKQTIGEHLYPLIFKLQPELAGKITGMILEMDIGELLNLIEEPNLLEAQVKEAVEVLQQHNQSPSEA